MPWLLGLLLCAALALLPLLPTTARAEAHAAVAEMQLEPGPEGLYLTASTQFDLPSLAEDALYKGISMYFVAEAEVLHERWYWSDKVVARATRHMRLSYQPLTRRWRLNLSTGPFAASGLGVSLGQSFDELTDALSAMERLTRWKIADAGALAHGTEYVVNFQFRLDMSQLPRPFQIGAMGRSGWNLLTTRTARVVFPDAEK
ncbi:MAG: DUF4390 domain-containing protein [Comamonadaceae bacterium]|nr:MAG: DUF4390 domain-containing protein [Comamonadaceae bacterium]